MISPLLVPSSTSIFNEVHDFQKGIKCNLMLYPIFKDDRQYFLPVNGELLEISPLHVPSSTSIFNEVHDFQKGIKCNVMLYPIFKDDRQYDSWYCELTLWPPYMAQKLSLIQIIAPQKLLKLYYG